MFSETDTVCQAEAESLHFECSYSNELLGKAFSIFMSILVLGLAGFGFWLSFAAGNLIAPQRILFFLMAFGLSGAALVAGPLRWREMTRAFALTPRGIKRLRRGSIEEFYPWEDLEYLRLRNNQGIPVFKFRNAPSFPLTFNLVAHPSKQDLGATKERIIAWLNLANYVDEEARIKTHVERRLIITLGCLFLAVALCGKWLQLQHVGPATEGWLFLGLMIPLVLLGACFEMYLRRRYREAYQRLRNNSE